MFVVCLYVFVYVRHIYKTNIRTHVQYIHACILHAYMYIRFNVYITHVHQVQRVHFTCILHMYLVYHTLISHMYMTHVYQV